MITDDIKNAKTVEFKEGELIRYCLPHDKYEILVPTSEISKKEFHHLYELVNDKMLELYLPPDYNIYICKRLIDPIEYGIIAVINDDVSDVIEYGDIIAVVGFHLKDNRLTAECIGYPAPSKEPKDKAFTASLAKILKNVSPSDKDDRKFKKIIDKHGFVRGFSYIDD